MQRKQRKKKSRKERKSLRKKYVDEKEKQCLLHALETSYEKKWFCILPDHGEK